MDGWLIRVAGGFVRFDLVFGCLCEAHDRLRQEMAALKWRVCVV